MNKVRQILKSKGQSVWTISSDATVLDALKLMAEKQIGSVVVVNGNTVAGIFTERDYARKVGLKDERPSAIKIEDVMSRDLITITPDTSINNCMSLITDNRVRHLPVMEGNQLVGLVSIGDVVKDIIEELQFMVKQLENYILNFR